MAPEKIVRSSETISGVFIGSVTVRNNSELTIEGAIQGSLSVESGKVIINGKQQGSVNISAGSYLINNGAIEGSVNIELDAILENLSNSKLAGSLNVSGTLNNYGSRGGTVSGAGTINDLPGSVVKQPTVIHGVSVYTW